MLQNTWKHTTWQTLTLKLPSSTIITQKGTIYIKNTQRHTSNAHNDQSMNKQIHKIDPRKNIPPTTSNQHKQTAPEPTQHGMPKTQRNIQPLDLVFFDEHEQRWLDMGQQEKQQREERNPLNRNGYAHHDDPNIQIYPERRDREPWTEQIELNWFDPEPITKAQQKREQLAIRELA